MKGATPAAVVAVAAIAAFARTAGHGFLFWDDRAFIAGNPLVVHPSAANLLALWTRPLNDLYAPLTYTLWALLAAVVGPAPWAFHLTNVALHALDAVLVFLLLKDLTGPGALAGALVFAVHPLQTETVAWASETKDLLAALGSLLAMRWHLASRDRPALAAFVCALLAKPTAVVAPVLLLVLDRGLRGRSWREGVRGLWPWFAGAGLFVLLGAAVQPAADRLRWVAPLWLRPALALDALSFYVGKVLLPLRLVPDYGRTSQSVIASGALAWTWMPATALLATVWRFRRKRPALAVAVALFVAALLPVLGLVPFDFQYYSNVADHYLYLAMLGPALGVAFAYEEIPAGRFVVPAAVAALLALSIVQASRWQDDATLYAHTLAVNPRSLVAHNNLGQALEERAEYEAALAHYRAALDADPGDANVLNNVGNVLYKQGRYDDAIRHYTEVLGQGSVPAVTAARMHNNRAAAYIKREMYDQAVADLQRAIALDPAYLEPYYNLGSVLMAFGRNAEAAEVFRRGLAVDPGHAALRSQLDLAVSRSGR